MKEREREVTGKEVEKKKKKKCLRYGDEEETEFVQPAGYHHHLPTTVHPLPDLGYRNWHR